LRCAGAAARLAALPLAARALATPAAALQPAAAAAAAQERYARCALLALRHAPFRAALPLAAAHCAGDKARASVRCIATLSRFARVAR
jgi:hypothetical protein